MSWKGSMLRAGMREYDLSSRRLSGLINGYDAQGKVIYVDVSKAANGGGRSPRNAKNTIALGEGALTAGKNDVLRYLQSTSGGSIVDTLAQLRVK